MSPICPDNPAQPLRSSPCDEAARQCARPLSHRSESVGSESAETHLASRAATMLPAELLQPGEVIILLLKPSPLYILLAPLGTLLGLAAITAAAVWVNQKLNLGLARQDLLLIGSSLIGLRLFWQFLEWLSRVYVLTDRRIISVHGVLRITVIEAPLQQIQQTYATFSIRERLFGLGTIAFATAGTAFVEAYWQMIARPLEVHQKVVQTINRYRRH